jgi:hypothetical protein
MAFAWAGSLTLVCHGDDIITEDSSEIPPCRSAALYDPTRCGYSADDSAVSHFREQKSV